MDGRSSPYLFDTLPTAIEWICRNNYNLPMTCHLLDDFLGAESKKTKGQFLKVVLKLFDELGVPMSSDKVHGPLTCLEFLGITLDTVRMEARLSVEKIINLQETVLLFSSKKKCTKRELLSLIGSLSFACKVIIPGRPFLARLISLSCTVQKLEHKIYLNQHVREDLEAWHTFLTTWNGKSFFLDKNTINAPDLEFYTDAAGTLGYGAYFQGSWFSAPWEEHQLQFSMSAMGTVPYCCFFFCLGSVLVFKTYFGSL